MSKATAVAHSNIAFIKYWGNADPVLHLPANPSISMNLSELHTVTTVALTDGPEDEITIDEAYQKHQDGVFFLDVRTQEEWDDFHAPNTTLIPLDQLPARLSELPQGEEIVVVCRSGNRSQAGRNILRENGFEQSTSMAGGLTAWRSAGYPTE